MATKEDPNAKCVRCGAPASEHKYHPEKNPRRAGTAPGSRCKGFVPHEGGKAD